MRTQYENTAILLIIKEGGGRVSLDGVTACGLVNGPSDISYRVAKGASDRSSARPPCLQVPQWHPCVAKESSIGSSARRPLPQPSQSHPRVAKRSSDRSSARPPCLQTPQRQIALRGEANWTSPSKRLCPTPTLKGISRLDRQDK